MSDERAAPTLPDITVGLWRSCSSSCGVGRKDVPPTGDIWTLAQQLATFTLGHTAPDTPFDAIVKGFGKAAGTYRTIRADPARASLLLAVGEQRVCHSATVRKKGPVISLVACHDSYSTLT